MITPSYRKSKNQQVNFEFYVYGREKNDFCGSWNSISICFVGFKSDRSRKFHFFFNKIVNNNEGLRFIEKLGRDSQRR